MAGPTCGLMLADMGADVYKVEKFPKGDDTRNYRREGDSGLPPGFMILNRGKKSIGINVKSELGKATLLRMVAQADVLTENFRMGVMERLGLGYDVLKEINPALIYCSITGYGRAGPARGKRRVRPDSAGVQRLDQRHRRGGRRTRQTGRVDRGCQCRHSCRRSACWPPISTGCARGWDNVWTPRYCKLHCSRCTGMRRPILPRASYRSPPAPPIR